MNPAIKQLVLNAQSEQHDVEREAVLQLALLLERHTTNNFTGDEPFYSANLPQEVLALHLDLSEQKEIVEALCDLIRSDRRTPGMAWALSKASNNIVCESLDQHMRDGFTTNDEVMFSQMLLVIDNCYQFPNDHNSGKYIHFFSSFLNNHDYRDPRVMEMITKMLKHFDL